MLPPACDRPCAPIRGRRVGCDWCMVLGAGGDWCMMGGVNRARMGIGAEDGGGEAIGA